MGMPMCDLAEAQKLLDERDAEIERLKAKVARLTTNPIKDLSDDDLVARACMSEVQSRAGEYCNGARRAFNEIADVIEAKLKELT